MKPQVGIEHVNDAIFKWNSNMGAWTIQSYAEKCKLMKW